MIRAFVAKLSTLGGVLVAAVLLTIFQPSPVGVGGREVRAAPGTPAAELRKSYDLTELRVINQTLVKIHDQYVDPTRIDPKQMLVAALDSVQRNIAEVLVESNGDKSEITVTVNDKTRTFTIGDVESMWKLASRLKQIFKFVQENMNAGSDTAQIEYAAVNGMLSTLDPHSVLLDPEAAREMDIQTSGKFGGIGIVIGVRKGKLSVIKLIDANTPAARVGLKAGDHIVKINDEPTVNLTLNEAMNRLRGDPNTKVSVTIERKGVSGQTAYQITRDIISVSVVEGRLLAGNVGYLKIDNFQSNVERDLKAAMENLKRKGAKAWVLDLRYNPGGLLDQAVRVVDMFVESGTIVTTVSYAGKQRKEERAEADDGDSRAPLAVLVNGGSASASEIVAGALKNLDRAVIIGRTTFGKGSVQVLFDFNDRSKLKLTIAQYLTPGDLSIQSVGIPPDIELVPAVVPDQIVDASTAVRLLGLGYRMREADLDAHLTSKNTAKQTDKPSDVVKYLYVKPKSADDDETESPDGTEPILDEETPPDEFVEDFEIQFARDFVAQATSSRRRDMLNGAKSYLARRKGDEDGKIAAALSKLGIDWGAAKATSARLAATVTSDRPGNTVKAGETIAITGSVTNNGTEPAYQVHARAQSDDYTFEDTELVFGRIDPGQTKTQTVHVKVPKDAASRVDGVEWVFTESNGAKVDVRPFKVTVQGLPRPVFAYTYQLIDEVGNGDGLLQLGESYRLLVTVKNVGEGKGSSEVTAMLKNVSGDGVIVNKGRFALNDIAPGATQTIEFTFDVKKDFSPDDKTLVLEMSVYDQDLREGVNEKLKFPLRPAAAGPRPENGTVKTKRDLPVREGAAADSAIIGTARKGALLKVTGREGDWVRVEIDKGRPGFVAAADVGKGNGAASPNAFTPLWQVTPPTLSLQVPSLETTGDKWRLVGTATDDNHVEDIFVIVSNRDSKIEGKKVYYLSSRGKKSQNKIDFAADIPVWPGNNMVTVIARENNDVRAVETIFIYRTDGVKAAAR